MIPCSKCGQLKIGLYHSTEKDILELIAILNEYKKLNYVDEAYRQESYIARKLDYAYKIGYNGHPYQSMSNLDYLEWKYEQSL